MMSDGEDERDRLAETNWSVRPDSEVPDSWDEEPEADESTAEYRNTGSGAYASESWAAESGESEMTIAFAENARPPSIREELQVPNKPQGSGGKPPCSGGAHAGAMGRPRQAASGTSGGTPAQPRGAKHTKSRAMLRKEKAQGSKAQKSSGGDEAMVDLAADQRKASTAALKEEEEEQEQDSAAAGASLPDVCIIHTIRVLSWNIGGLSRESLDERANAALDVILAEDPDVVFLQEFVPRILKLWAARLRGKYVLLLGDERCPYTTAILFARTTCRPKDSKVIPFPLSTMGRNLLVVNARIKGVDFVLMTSHLESSGPAYAERQRQLRRAFVEMKNAPSAYNVLFGGDLNVRERDVTVVNGLPNGAQDVWVAMGSHPDTQYTWDTQLNDNLAAPYIARLRFDRFIFRPANAGGVAAKPVLFRTVGRERIPACGKYPSDHWGIVAHFAAASCVKAQPQ